MTACFADTHFFLGLVPRKDPAVHDGGRSPPLRPAGFTALLKSRA
jgi:hypothetical protein